MQKDNFTQAMEARQALRNRAQRKKRILMLWVGVVLIVLASLWVINIVSLSKLDAFSGMMVVRVIGIPFAPVGVIFGGIDVYNWF